MKIIKSLKSRKSRRSLRAEQHSLIIQYLSHMFYSFISSFHRFIYLLVVAEKSAAAEGEYIPIERRESGAAILFSHQFPSFAGWCGASCCIREREKLCGALGLSTARIRHFAGFTDTKAVKM